jgi:hypothetical protein
MSAKLIRETDSGLALVNGAEPAWWASEGIMRGFPSPEKVRGWFDDGGSPNGPVPRDNRKLRNHPDSGNGLVSDKHSENDLYGSVAGRDRLPARDHPPIARTPTSENGSSKTNAGTQGKAITPITSITVVEGDEDGAGEKNGSHPSPLTVEDALAEMNVGGSRSAKVAAAYARGQTRVRYLVRAVLNARGLDVDDWEYYVPVITAAFERWNGGS